MVSSKNEGCSGSKKERCSSTKLTTYSSGIISPLIRIRSRKSIKWGRWIVLPGNRRTAIRLRWYVNRILFHWFRRYVSSWIVDEDAQNVRPICVWSLNPAYMLCLLFVETLAHSHISTLKCSDSPCFIIFNVGQSLLPANLFIFRTVNLTINGDWRMRLQISTFKSKKSWELRKILC